MRASPRIFSASRSESVLSLSTTTLTKTLDHYAEPLDSGAQLLSFAALQLEVHGEGFQAFINGHRGAEG